MAERRRRHPGVAGVDAHVDAVRDEHLDGAALGGERQPVRVAAEEQRTVRCPARCGSRRSPGSSRGCASSLKLDDSDEPRWPLVPKATRCSGDRGIRLAVVVGVDQLVDVDQVGGFGGLSCSAHAPQSARSVPRGDSRSRHACAGCSCAATSSAHRRIASQSRGIAELLRSVAHHRVLDESLGIRGKTPAEHDVAAYAGGLREFEHAVRLEPLRVLLEVLLGLLADGARAEDPERDLRQGVAVLLEEVARLAGASVRRRRRCRG